MISSAFGTDYSFPPALDTSTPSKSTLVRQASTVACCRAAIFQIQTLSVSLFISGTHSQIDDLLHLYGLDFSIRARIDEKPRFIYDKKKFKGQHQSRNKSSSLCPLYSIQSPGQDAYLTNAVNIFHTQPTTSQSPNQPFPQSPTQSIIHPINHPINHPTTQSDPPKNIPLPQPTAKSARQSRHPFSQSSVLQHSKAAPILFNYAFTSPTIALTELHYIKHSEPDPIPTHHSSIKRLGIDT